ncbi:MAG TPA: tetratricopeptide repeat protein, partial [Steroidobacteraceae bacterium]|nr:tetratricopeptide repeat protein [Steroidobacteraceae bacterium]
AKSSLTRSLAIAGKKWGPRRLDLRAPLAGLAKVLVEQCELATARAHLERALAIVEPQFPPEHVDVLHTLSSIATAIVAAAITRGRDPCSKTCSGASSVRRHQASVRDGSVARNGRGAEGRR